MVAYLISNKDYIPKKRLGQHFLRDKNISNKMVDLIPDDIKERVIEVGPGLGILTESLLRKGYSVIAIELDRDLISYLERRFENIIDDRLILKNMDIIEYLKGIPDRIPFIVSNLPYNISTEFIFSLLNKIDINSDRINFSGAIVMLQKEFGERLIAESNSKKYGRLSVNFQLKMEYQRIMNVPRTSFMPPPDVDSIIIKFYQRSCNKIVPNDKELLNNILRVTFRNRRKMLKNTLQKESLKIDVENEALSTILKQRGWHTSRPEQLSPEEFVLLADEISEYNG